MSYHIVWLSVGEMLDSTTGEYKTVSAYAAIATQLADGTWKCANTGDIITWPVLKAEPWDVDSATKCCSGLLKNPAWEKYGVLEYAALFNKNKGVKQ